jgi:hypothetical protein
MHYVQPPVLFWTLERYQSYLVSPDCSGPEKAFYIMQYATKDQNIIENPLALDVHAYDKA